MHAKHGDSYKIINFSLDKISSTYGYSKLNFPYRFMDSYAKINYIGNKPDIKEL